MEDEYGQTYGEGVKPFSEAWIKYILQFNIPKDDKNPIINMLKPIMDAAPKSNIKRSSIVLSLDAYDIIWEKYLTYVKKGKYDPNLITLREALREGYYLSLTRGVDMSQMKLIFINKYDISQRNLSSTARKLQLFRRKKAEPQQPMEE